jgi:hypothetical protein
MNDDPELTTKNIKNINKHFYDASPWTYFQHRLGHLMLSSAGDKRLQEALQDGVTVDGVTLRIEAPEEPETYPTPTQSFVAVELEVLLHHTAETLLRFVHAHAKPDETCPSIRLARLKSAARFKQWVEEHVRDAPDHELEELCGLAFACDPSSRDDVAAYGEHLRLFARHFLDSDSYNAAKHGMTVQGGSNRIQLQIDEWEAVSQDGVQVSWIARWPRDDPERPARWTRAHRLMSEGAVIALIHMATQMMKSIWIRGRNRHLGEKDPTVLRPSSADQLFAQLGIRSHVLLETYHPFAEDGGTESLIFKTAHLKPPSS